MAKFDYEINKALHETKLTREKVTEAMAGKSNKNILGNFMKALSHHLHGEGMSEALRSLEPKKDIVEASIEQSSGDQRVDRALKDANLSFTEAKRLVAMTFGYGESPDPMEKTRCFRFTGCLRRYMSLDAAKTLVDSWAMVEDPLVKTASRIQCDPIVEWVHLNCKFAQAY